MNKIQKKIEEHIEKVIISEITMTADIAGYNSPFYLTDEDYEHIPNREAHNKIRQKTHGALTKKELEAALGQSMDGSAWINNKKTDEIAKKSRLQKKVKKIQQGVIAEADEKKPDDTEPVDNQEEVVEQKFDKEAHKILYNVGLRELAKFYNTIILPAFASIGNRFLVSKDKAVVKNRLQLFSFYVFMDNVMMRINPKELDQKKLMDYQAVMEAQKTIPRNIANASKQMNLEAVKEEEELKTIQQRIDINTKSIVSIFQTMFAPIENGYLEELKSISTQIANTAPYKASEKIAQTSATIYIHQISQVFPELFAKQKGNFAGTWIINAMNIVLQNNPIEYTVTYGTNKNINLLNPTSTTNEVETKIAGLFKDIQRIFDEYDKKLYAFCFDIDVSKFIQDDNLNIKALRDEIRQKDIGFFNQRLNEVLASIKQEFAVYKKEFFDKEVKFKNAKKDEIEESWSGVRKYIEKNLGFQEDKEVNDGQKELISVALRSLDSFHDGGDKGVRFTGIDNEKDEKDVHDLLKNGVLEQGGIAEFVQAYLAGNYKDECVLLGAGKYSLRKIIEDLSDKSVKQKSEDEEYENEYGDGGKGQAKPLVTVMPTKEYNVRVNGNTIQWNANNSVLKIYKNLIVWDFVKNLIAMSEKDWKESILTPDFFKKMVYTQRPPEETGNGKDFVNQDDVKESEERMREEGKTEFFEQDFSKDFKRIITTYPLSDNAKQLLAVNDAERMIRKYDSETKMRGLKKEQIDEIGRTLNEIFNRFKRINGTEYGIRSGKIRKDQAVFYAKNITQGLNFGDVSQNNKVKLEMDIHRILVFYDEKEMKQYEKQGKTPSVTPEMIDGCGNVLRVLKVFISQ